MEEDEEEDEEEDINMAVVKLALAQAKHYAELHLETCMNNTPFDYEETAFKQLFEMILNN